MWGLYHSTIQHIVIPFLSPTWLFTYRWWIQIFMIHFLFSAEFVTLIGCHTPPQIVNGRQKMVMPPLQYVSHYPDRSSVSTACMRALWMQEDSQSHHNWVLSTSLGVFQKVISWLLPKYLMKEYFMSSSSSHVALVEVPWSGLCPLVWLIFVSPIMDHRSVVTS